MCQSGGSTSGPKIFIFFPVTVNFATFLLAYSFLLIAFGLAFSVLFSNYPAFKLPASLVKTVMMMSGELEYEDIFYNNNDNSTSNSKYPVTAHGMFLTFVMLVTVILTNLLVGLAVSDIQVCMNCYMNSNVIFNFVNIFMPLYNWLRVFY